MKNTFTHYFKSLSLLLLIVFLGACEPAGSPVEENKTNVSTSAVSQTEDQRLAVFLDEVF